jgi:hypothetical protein
MARVTRIVLLSLVAWAGFSVAANFEGASARVNVMDFGAKADGVGDDSAAILAAIKAADGKEVYLPAGRYRLAYVFTVPAGAHLIGDGRNTSWLQGQLVFGSSSTFSDLKIGPVSAGVTGIRNVDGATGSSFLRCRFRGGGGAGYNAPTMLLGGGRDLFNTTFADCEMERSLGVAADPAYPSYNLLSVICDGNVIDGLTFDGCHFGVSNGTAIGAERMMVECWTAHGLSNRWKNLTFRGCEFEPSNWHQLDFACYGDSGQGTGVLVEDCTFRGAGVPGRWLTTQVWGYAIALEWPAAVTIRNNHFHRCYEAAICSANYGQSYNTAWRITGNTFDWDTAELGITARRGIVVLTGANNIVTGNVFRWHGQFSAWPSNGCVELGGVKATGNTVTGNRFNLATLYASAIIQAGGAADNTVSPNTVVRQ